MRIVSATVSGIGGLVDQTIVVPRTPVVALAGPNGTGKSKLLGALISPWSRQLPNPRSGCTASVEIEVDLSEPERSAIESFSSASGWGHVDVRGQVVLGIRHNPYTGVQFQVRSGAAPDAGLVGLPTALSEFPANEMFLLENRSLNPMYLPAERRLMPAGVGAIDMHLLDDESAYRRSAESRQAVSNYGRLDDGEFEQFAKALCMADKLDNEPGSESEPTTISRVGWEQFRDTVNSLLHPKVLLPLTRQYPDALRIQLPNGEVHAVADLSSGERQALIIISRVLRAGAGQSIVLIDEPDAYLHPNLSQRLIDVLIDGVGPEGQMLIATHSPAILDRIAPSSIIRLDHDNVAMPVSDTSGLIELHRNTGFKASALTQSDLLVVTEGDLDEVVLKLLYPQLTRASISQGQGRAGVVSKVEHLASYGVPVIGLVDHDIEPPLIDLDLKSSIVVLSTADIEGAFIFDDTALQLMIDLRLTKDSHRDLVALRSERDQIVAGLRENTIAEIMQAKLRSDLAIGWPSPRGANPIDRLRSVASAATTPDDEAIDAALSAANQIWEDNQTNLARIVRGKYVLGEFTSRATNLKTGPALIELLATQRPTLEALDEFSRTIATLLE